MGVTYEQTEQAVGLDGAGLVCLRQPPFEGLENSVVGTEISIYIPGYASR